MSVKHILITGSTDGIGRLAAANLAREGHHIIVHGRSQQKVDATVAQLKSQATHYNIAGVVADLSDLRAVGAMAEEISANHQLDVLINNAGVYHSNATSTITDIRFVVNYLAPYLLTQKLIPLLEKSDDARIINLSSAAQSPVSLQALSGQKKLSVQEAYAQSKLALTMWSFALARKYSDMTIIPVNPGSLLNTKMVKEAFGQHWSSADKGAEILTALATKDIYKTQSGKYYDNDRGAFGPAHADAYDEHKIDELMLLTEDLV